MFRCCHKEQGRLVPYPMEDETSSLLYATHEAKGFKMDVMDSLIAATALVHQLTVVTRNTADFPADVKVSNPWRE